VSESELLIENCVFRCCLGVWCGAASLQQAKALAAASGASTSSILPTANLDRPATAYVMEHCWFVARGLVAHTTAPQPRVRVCSIACGIIQSNLQQCMALLLHKEAKVRSVCLALVETLLSQGALHSGQCAEYLIVLLADHERVIADKAYNLLAFIHEKHPSELVPFLASGIHRAYDFQLKTFDCGRWKLAITRCAIGVRGSVADVHLVCVAVCGGVWRCSESAERRLDVRVRGHVQHGQDGQARASTRVGFAGGHVQVRSCTYYCPTLARTRSH